MPAKTTRKKPTQTPQLETIEDVERVLKLIHTATGVVDKAEQKSQERINEIKEKTKAINKPLVDQIKQQESQVFNFLSANKKTLFAKTRSLKLATGTVGFRRSTKITTLTKKIKWADVLIELKVKNLKMAIRGKETVNKEELHRLDDDTLESVGCKRDLNDDPYYEFPNDLAEPTA